MYSKENPWIAEREATVCTWKFDYNRGHVSNINVSLVNDFMCLSERQLKNYAQMLKECGMTGVQVMDICAAWRASGSWENVHDKFKAFANACHNIGLNFTVWCWAAEFSGYGWSDSDAVYCNSDPSKPAYEDEHVRALFNKYYDIYADLAPYADRVIAHFFDPGNLSDIPSIIYFIKLLESKFKAKNPNIKIAVDTWGCPKGYPEALVDAGMKDVMLMELPFLPVWRQPGKRAAFREGVKKLGCDLGSWGWYTTDMEIDQLAIMTVNNRSLKDVFNQTRAQADHVLIPRYWSDTDSYHILNFFSLYAAGHLLINPDDDPDKLLRDASRAVTGSNKENENRLVSVLELIRDARSGDSWDSYWWTEPGYILKNYNGSILSRVDGAISALEKLIIEPEPTDGIAFPLTRKQLYRLILPHLYQIKQYAEFSHDFETIKKMKQNGASAEELQKKIDALDCEIPEYNCVTGLWGQAEARAAFEQTAEFCAENGLIAPQRSSAVRFEQKRRLIDCLRVKQRGRIEPVFITSLFYEGGIIGVEYTDSLLEELAFEKVLVKNEDGKYALSDYQKGRFDFSI